MSFAANPRHPNNPPSDPPSEPTGLVAKDSLANESIQSGGGFAENPNPEVIGVEGSKSTLANTETSGAEKLDAAQSSTIRDGDEAEKYPDAEATAGFAGTTSDQGFVGGSTTEERPKVITIPSDEPTGDETANLHSGIPRHNDDDDDNDGEASKGTVDTAPGYTIDAVTEGDLKPKGKNLVEGGDIPPNRTTRTGDVGGPNDPGRLAEAKFAAADADMSAGLGARQYGEVDKHGDQSNPYDALSSERI